MSHHKDLVPFNPADAYLEQEVFAPYISVQLFPISIPSVCFPDMELEEWPLDGSWRRSYAAERLAHGETMQGVLGAYRLAHRHDSYADECVPKTHGAWVWRCWGHYDQYYGTEHYQICWREPTGFQGNQHWRPLCTIRDWDEAYTNPGPNLLEPPKRLSYGPVLADNVCRELTTRGIPHSDAARLLNNKLRLDISPGQEGREPWRRTLGLDLVETRFPTTEET